MNIVFALAKLYYYSGQNKHVRFANYLLNETRHYCNQLSCNAYVQSKYAFVMHSIEIINVFDLEPIVELNSQ